MPSVAPMNSLTEEYGLMTELFDLMQQEQALLVAADIDGLTELTARKTPLVQRLAQLSRSRHAALGAAGHPAREEGMNDWLAAEGDEAAAALWSQLLEVTRAAKELNRVNGMLVNKHLAHTQGALNTLRPPAQAGNFYGPSGQTTSSSSSRRFVIG
ncbi:MAG TPA: flagellar biosynthesis protein FlgN [Janthinobacterium sp.]|nr:flagellar biosynthesis protein FlgN [Janthinobacterium sp.]